MATAKICDACGKQVERFAFKLFVSQYNPNQPKGADYASSADICQDCIPRVNQFVKWHKRVRRPKKVENV